jgi:hypothetical protein
MPPFSTPNVEQSLRRMIENSTPEALSHRMHNMAEPKSERLHPLPRDNSGSFSLGAAPAFVASALPLG